MPYSCQPEGGRVGFAVTIRSAIIRILGRLLGCSGSGGGAQVHRQAGWQREREPKRCQGDFRSGLLPPSWAPRYGAVLQRGGVGLTGADANGAIHLADEDLAVANFAGLGRL